MLEIRNLRPIEQYGANCYLLSSGDDFAVIDPSADYEDTLRVYPEIEGRVRFVLLTHAHFDHMLAAKKFNQENIIFPVSAVLYKNARLYDSMLESFSKKLLPFVDYQLADDGSMTVLNDTADFYRFINFTSIVEKFIDVVEEAIKSELLPELDYLVAWERAREKMRDIVDMPERKVMLFIKFTEQNNGIFPKSRRDSFSELTDYEIATLADIIKNEIILRKAKS